MSAAPTTASWARRTFTHRGKSGKHSNAAGSRLLRVPEGAVGAAVRAGVWGAAAYLSDPVRARGRVEGSVVAECFGGDERGHAEGVSAGWVPAPVEDSVMLSRRDRLQRGTQTVRLYSPGNRFWGRLLPWLLLGAAFVWLNGSALTWSDPLTAGELIFGAGVLMVLSFGTYFVLGRGRVDIDTGLAKVRNPLKVYEVPLASVDRVDRTFWGSVRLAAGADRVTLWGLDQPLRQAMRGYTEDVQVLLAEVAAAGGVGELADGPQRSEQQLEHAARAAALVAAERRSVPSDRLERRVRSRWAVMDASVWLLSVGWCGQLAMTVPALLRQP